MSSETRRSEANAIWLCKPHHTIVDRTNSDFAVEDLQQMKSARQAAARQELLNLDYAFHIRDEIRAEGALDPSEAFARLCIGSQEDLKRLKKRAIEWPPSNVMLTLSGPDLGAPFSAEIAARLLRGYTHLILKANPGFGKSAALCQLVEHANKDEEVAAIHVSLPRWVLTDKDILDFVLSRAAYATLDRTQFRSAATQGRVFMCLDGWNELGPAQRRRAHQAIEDIVSDWPELGIIVATRETAAPIPLSGQALKLEPLSVFQQDAIAATLSPDIGLTLLRTARNTPRLAELIKIPLYLRALLTVKSVNALPQTPSGLIALVADPELADNLRVGQLADVLEGQAKRYLTALATEGLNVGTVLLSEPDARRVVSTVSQTLVNEGQIAVSPSTDLVLKTLLGHTALRFQAGDAAYGFDHQQIQEWHGSYHAEALMRAAVTDAVAKKSLEALLDNRAWEEALVFAVDRLSIGGPLDLSALANTAQSAFEIDPLLCADWLREYAATLWPVIEEVLTPALQRWRTQHWEGWISFAGRAALPHLAPDVIECLQAHPHDGVRALYSYTHHLPARVFGTTPLEAIRKLPDGLRINIVNELAAGRDPVGHTLAKKIAIESADEDLRYRVMTHLYWAGAWEALSEIVMVVSQEELVTLARLLDDYGFIDQMSPDAIACIEEAVAQHQASVTTPIERLKTWWRGSARARHKGSATKDSNNDIASADITAAIVTMDLDHRSGSFSESPARNNEQLISQTFSIEPGAVRAGLIERLRLGLRMPFRVQDMLDDPTVLVEAPWVLENCLDISVDNDRIAALLLDPSGIFALLEATIAAWIDVLDAPTPISEPIRVRWNELSKALGRCQSDRLVPVLLDAAPNIDVRFFGKLSRILNRDDRDRPHSDVALEGIREIFEIARFRVLRETPRDRRAMTDVAKLIEIAPAPDSLPGVLELAEADTALILEFKAEVAQDPNYHIRHHTQALNESRWPHEGEFGRVFRAIGGEHVKTAMLARLNHPRLGPTAAQTLKFLELRDYEAEGQSVRFGENYEAVALNREALANDKLRKSPYCASILSAVRKRWDDPNSETNGQAVEMLMAAARLPHGRYWDEISDKLQTLSARSQEAILTAAGLSGRPLPSALLLGALEQLFEDAKTHSWLGQFDDDWSSKRWINLCIFAEDPSVVLEMMDRLPEESAKANNFETFLLGIATIAPSQADVLAALLDRVPDLHRSISFYSAVERTGSAVLALRWLDAVNAAGGGGLHIDPLFGRHKQLFRNTEVKAAVKARLKVGQVDHLKQLIPACIRSGDVDLLLASVDSAAAAPANPFSGFSAREFIEASTPIPGQSNLYSTTSIDASELRSELLRRCYADCPKIRNVSVRFLRDIDEHRQAHGAPLSEPRHPRLGSGLSWPILEKEI